MNMKNRLDNNMVWYLCQYSIAVGFNLLMGVLNLLIRGKVCILCIFITRLNCWRCMVEQCSTATTSAHFIVINWWSLCEYTCSVRCSVWIYSPFPWICIGGEMPLFNTHKCDTTKNVFVYLPKLKFVVTPFVFHYPKIETARTFATVALVTLAGLAVSS